MPNSRSLHSHQHHNRLIFVADWPLNLLLHSQTVLLGLTGRKMANQRMNGSTLLTLLKRDVEVDGPDGDLVDDGKKMKAGNHAADVPVWRQLTSSM